MSYTPTSYPHRAANPELAAPGEGWEPIHAIHRWLLENAATARADLERRIRSEREDEANFLEGGYSYAGTRWATSKDELVGRFEALQSVARFLGFELPVEEEEVPA